MESTLKASSTVVDTGEKTPLLTWNAAPKGKVVEVVPMKYGDLLTGAESARKAFADDPLMKYLIAEDTFPVTRMKLINMVNWMGAMRQHRMLTIDGGLSLMKYGPPGNQEDLPFISFLIKSLGRSRPKECTKRWKEFGVKAQALVLDAFGDKIPNMYEIQALCTDPDAQGRGYASALVQYVLRQSDAEGRDVWLLTTGADGFYKHFGFTIVRSGAIAVDNPKWDGEPVTLNIMHRSANTCAAMMPAGTEARIVD